IFMADRRKKSSAGRWTSRSPKTWRTFMPATWPPRSSTPTRGSRTRPPRNRRRSRRQPMRLTLLHDLARFLTALEQTQESLLTLLTAKRNALDHFLSEELIRLRSEEHTS